jgi:ABC-2 type transport system permease protein
MNIDRVVTLIGKELREFRASPAAVVPAALVVIVTILLPFLVIVIVPRATGQSLTADPAIKKALEFARAHTPHLAGLSLESAVEAFLFQQFLLLFLLVPIVGAVSLGAYSVVGEKQGRTLEPLLTTPLSTSELLIGKALASFIPSLLMEMAGVAVYFLLIAIVGLPGVLGSLLTVRTGVLLFVVGPLAALVALQATIAVSSRANDPRSAQQVALLVVLPLVMLFVGQLAGAFFLTSALLLVLAALALAVWVLLIMLSVALFDRETILTRWK